VREREREREREIPICHIHIHFHIHRPATSRRVLEWCGVLYSVVIVLRWRQQSELQDATLSWRWCEEEEEEEEEEEGGGGERCQCGTLMSMETHIHQKKDLIMMTTCMTIQMTIIMQLIIITDIWMRTRSITTIT
jgi:hypothetical protein